MSEAGRAPARTNWMIPYARGDRLLRKPGEMRLRPSGQIQSACSAQNVDVNENIKETRNDRFGMLRVASDPIGVRQRKHRKGIGRVALADCHFQRFGPFRIPIARDQDDLVVLAGLPDRRVTGIAVQAEILERAKNAFEVAPQFYPSCRLANIHQTADVPLDVVIRHDS